MTASLRLSQVTIAGQLLKGTNPHASRGIDENVNISANSLEEALQLLKLASIHLQVQAVTSVEGSRLAGSAVLTEILLSVVGLMLGPLRLELQTCAAEAEQPSALMLAATC